VLFAAAVGQIMLMRGNVAEKSAHLRGDKNKIQKRIATKREIGRRRRAQNPPSEGIHRDPRYSLLAFNEFVRLRKLAKANHDLPKPKVDPTGDYVLDHGYFTNIDRLQDPGSIQLLQAAWGLAPEGKVAVCYVYRHLASPKNGDDIDSGGARSLAAVIKGGGLRKLAEELERDAKCVRSGARTYVSVISKTNLACILRSGVCKSIMKEASFSSLKHLMDVISRESNRHISTRLRRNLEFHSLQIAFDLVAMKLVTILDRCKSCPVVGGGKGSAAGLQHVRRMAHDRSLRLEDVAAEAGLTCIHSQTGLCSYDKYIRWSIGQTAMREYVPARLR